MSVHQIADPLIPFTDGIAHVLAVTVKVLAICFATVGTVVHAKTSVGIFCKRTTWKLSTCASYWRLCKLLRHLKVFRWPVIRVKQGFGGNDVQMQNSNKWSLHVCSYGSVQVRSSVCEVCVAAVKMVADTDGDTTACSIEEDRPKPTVNCCQFSSSAC